VKASLHQTPGQVDDVSFSDFGPTKKEMRLKNKVRDFSKRGQDDEFQLIARATHNLLTHAG